MFPSWPKLLTTKQCYVSVILPPLVAEVENDHSSCCGRNVKATKFIYNPDFKLKSRSDRNHG